eukprot:CAMPEP_0183704188 /NCGR_PEP_ID=MMETSP0737-20130205/1606_1 /TAXON_ID=385413 /ORGANISM="Thalassiosira miniscula, Strain CCMP1093" /LENGTH=484 /DNA_ID=CAMNT_0025931011 /DNA_START=27 /DNA_END=1481 /DNA_ORIENTATION=-
MAAISNEEEDFNEAPAFIDMNSAVEVDVPDGNPNDDEMMMDDDARDEHPSKTEGASSTTAAPIADQSKATFTSHTDAIYAVASHYDASSHTLSIASGGGDDRAYLHRITTASQQLTQQTIPLTHPHTDSISCLAFNSSFIAKDVSGKVQQNLLAVGSYDGAIVLYDATDGTLHHVLEGPSDVEWTCFHPKGGTVLLAGSIADGTIWMYHVPSKSCMQVFVGHEGGVTAGAFTPDGKWVVSAGRDGTCRVWAPKTGMSKHVFRLMEQMGGGGDEAGPGLTCLAVGGGQDGQLAICGGEDGNAYVVHISGKKLVATLPHYEEQPNNNTGASNATAATGGDDDMEEEEEGEARSIEAVGFCPPNIPGVAHWCATGGVDGILKIWNMNVTSGGGTAQLRQRCFRDDSDPERPPAGITRLSWHASLPLVICAYTDGIVGVWDVRVGKMVGTLSGHADMINDMSNVFVENTAVVCTGSDDKTVKMFEFQP